METPRGKLTELRIGNFKAFGEVQHIPIRPLTLIFGPNSSGKSTIIHSLALLHEAERTGSFRVGHPAISGLSIDLGGFEQYVHGRKLENTVLLGATFTVKDEESLGAPYLFYFDLTIGQKVRSSNGRLEANAGIRTCKIGNRNGSLVTVGYGAPWLLHPNVSYQNAIRNGLKTKYENLRLYQSEDKTKLSAVKKELHNARAANARFRAEMERELSDLAGRLQRTSARERIHWEPHTRWSKLVPAGVRMKRGNKHTLLSEPICSYLDQVAAILNQSFIESIESLRYLGPLRAYPPRHLPIPEEDPNWEAAGGYAWDTISRDEKLRQAVNTWLSKDYLKTKYEIRILRYLSSDRIEKLLQDDFKNHESQLTKGLRNPKQRDKFLKQLVDSINREGAFEIRLFDRNTKTLVSHRDVGVGISQLLPVLVAAYGSEGKIIAVEQPELHLHPALQAELGDLFIEAAKVGRRNTVIIETHSEHLLLRVMRRIRETTTHRNPSASLTLKPTDVAVLYVDPLDGGGVIREIPLNEQGELVKPWPGGFFEEGLREMF